MSVLVAQGEADGLDVAGGVVGADVGQEHRASARAQSCRRPRSAACRSRSARPGCRGRGRLPRNGATVRRPQSSACDSPDAAGIPAHHVEASGATSTRERLAENRKSSADSRPGRPGWSAATRCGRRVARSGRGPGRRSSRRVASSRAGPRAWRTRRRGLTSHGSHRSGSGGQSAGNPLSVAGAVAERRRSRDVGRRDRAGAWSGDVAGGWSVGRSRSASSPPVRRRRDDGAAATQAAGAARGPLRGGYGCTARRSNWYEGAIAYGLRRMTHDLRNVRPPGLEDGARRHRGPDRTSGPTTLEIATLAEELGYDSIWVYDHFHNVPVPAHETMFECWTTHGGARQATYAGPPGPDGRLRRLPQPRRSLAKITSTIDVISGGRLDWGIGAGLVRQRVPRPTATTSRPPPTASACCARPSRS